MELFCFPSTCGEKFIPNIREADRRGALVGQQKEKEFERVPFFFCTSSLTLHIRSFDGSEIPFSFAV